MLKKTHLIPLLLFVLNYAHAQEFSSLNINNGLSNNQVNCVYKDTKGFMWFGTMSGLDRYDGYTFKIYRHTADSISLADDCILNIYPAPGNRLFVKTRTTDNLYDPVSEQFSDAAVWLRQQGLPGYGVRCIQQTNNTFWIAVDDVGLYCLDGNYKRLIRKNKVADLSVASGNRLVVLYLNGDIEMLNALSGKSVFYSHALTGYLEKPATALKVFVDAEDDMWVYSPGTDLGVLYFNPPKEKVKLLSSRNKILNNDIVNSIVQDDHGEMWIGTDHGGINIVNKNYLSAHYLMNNEEDITSVAENAIYALYKDNLGIIWCGTYKRGVSYCADSMMKFSLYRHKNSDSRSLSYNDVNCFAEDKKGNLWIGSNGGGLMYYDRKENTFKRFLHNPSNDNSVSNDVIVSLYIDAWDNLWIGYYFGGMDIYSNGKFTHYMHKDNDANSLANKSVWKIYMDRRNNFWVGTLGGGLDRYDPGNSIFYHNNINLPNSVHSNFISALTEDKNGDLWIGTAYGIDVLDKAKGIFVHYLKGSHQLSNDNVSSLLCDSDGNMWVGTREGLNVFDQHTQQFKSFRIEDGLPDNSIIYMLEDNEHHLWVSTSNGLSKITVTHTANGLGIQCRNYDDRDGLQGKAFNVNAGLKLRSGELVFGGADGFNIINPADIQQDKNAPPLVFTGLQLSNRIINVNEKINNHVVLPVALPEAKEIVLKYNENDFSIDFAALNFINTDKNTYSYKLEGFNKEWLTTDAKTRRITYTNINPGDYVLYLKARNEDGVWNEQGISLKITVLPPFWKTPLAYLLYLLSAVGVLYFMRRRVIGRAHRRFALQQERREAHQLHELDALKIKLFTNLSHEFRTPVSLILAPLEEIITHANEGDKQKLHLIRRNAKRLLNLVNQLMDFRKMEMQELKLVPVKGDVVRFVKEVAISFTDLAERKRIGFSYNVNCEQLYTLFDHDKLERILFNLLSNAFKFTPEGGNVSLTAEVKELSWLEIKVKDTGIGIPKERQEKIFEQFFQGVALNQGSGIGLAITKEFVKLCNGTITVDSEVDKGSCFTVRLPFAPLPPVITEKPVEEWIQEAPVLKDMELVRGKQTILLVEDNDDFRFYLKENLKTYYNIIEAADGRAGWQSTLSGHPDLVVSDINMPVMDGIELCKKIMHDNRTKHIPVILLTAMAGEQEQLRGLETGASDYMVKPFNFEIMLSRISNILARKVPVKHVIGQPETAHVPTPNEVFMQKALEIVERNLSNTSFSVEELSRELSRELCMNRVSVYRRVFSLTGLTPIEFIRTVRLQRAAQLLSNTGMNITEVAYEVGFNNPKYFTKYFKLAYNMRPSAYVAAMRK